MSTLSAILGLDPSTRILILGEGDIVLEAALSRAGGGDVQHSRDGRDVARASADVAVLARGCAADPRVRSLALAAAHRGLIPGGVLAAEFPSTTAVLSRLLLTYEGVDIAPDAEGGRLYGQVRRLVRRAGFAPVSGFICLPSLAEPHIMLPLDSRRASAFHFEPPFFIESGQRCVARTLLAGLARLGLLPWLAPQFTIIATRRGEGAIAEAA
jgi:hypothetical protein